MVALLVNRDAERTLIDDAVSATREGSSATLVLRGEAGIGKSTLLDYASRSAGDLRTVKIEGIESEMELGYAGLHQLLLPFLNLEESLAGPQRAAVNSAFGRESGPPPDRFMVGVTALTLLSIAATKQALLILVDDAQWIDRESIGALGFVARRLSADRIAMVFSVREPAERRLPLEGLPSVEVRGLADDDARYLLSATATGALEEQTGHRLVTETAGNPLALVVINDRITPPLLMGSSPLPDPLPVGRRLQDRFLRQVRSLPAEAQTLLLLVAAEPSGDTSLLDRAAQSLGLGALLEAVTPAESAGLLIVGRLVGFRHPLVRSAVYRGAGSGQRRRVHAALADATDPIAAPDRRAWHRAAAVTGPDESIAAELAQAAEVTRERGGYGGSATFLARAADLTPDERRRARRRLAAAQAELVAGSPATAQTLLDSAIGSLDEPVEHAQAERLRGAIRFATGQGAETTSILLAAARDLMPLDRRMARDTLLEAMEAAIYGQGAGGAAGLREVAGAARSAPAVDDAATTAADLLLDGFAALSTAGPEEGTPLLRRGIDRLLRTTDVRWFGLGCVAAAEIWDLPSWRELAERWVRLARSQGALGGLPVALAFFAGAYEMSGRLGAAKAAGDESVDISYATGNLGILGEAGRDALLLATLGQEREARTAIEAQIRWATSRGQGGTVVMAYYSLARLELSLARYGAALEAAQRVAASDSFYIPRAVLPELVEAAARAGDRQAAVDALHTLTPYAEASGTDWALGVLSRSRALVATDDEAEPLYRLAITQLKRSPAVPDLARTHLVFGEWLRRRRRRLDARSQLHSAGQLFQAMGAEGYAERTRVEILATGERARRRTPATSYDLTPQEARIARLAAEGESNQSIAAQLFISPSTVEYHLRKVFRKLSINSRSMLARSLDPST